MNANFYTNNPFRRPQWRADRALRMAEHRPKPLWPRGYDDHPVRAYRNLLLACMSAGTDEQLREAARLVRPDVHRAHMLHFAPDCQLRQILEARLLTNESLSEIAQRFATEEQTIEYYEQLFFNVRDRLQHKDWIAKIILGSPGDLAPNRRGSMTEAQRGFLYRLFAFHGGPLALDAMIGGMVSTKMPQRVEDVAPWFDGALGQIVRSRAAAAAKILDVNKHNIVHLLKLALGANRAGKRPAGKSPGVSPEYLEKLVSKLDWDLYKQLPDPNKKQTPVTTYADMPRPSKKQPIATRTVSAATARAAYRYVVTRIDAVKISAETNVGKNNETRSSRVGIQDETVPGLPCESSAEPIAEAIS